MARKRHTAEEIVAKLRQVDVLTAQGRPVAEAVRSIGVTEVTYYRWRNEYGGLKSDQVKRPSDRRSSPASAATRFQGRAANLAARSRTTLCVRTHSPCYSRRSSGT